jgi:hypothetical protein
MKYKLKNIDTFVDGYTGTEIFSLQKEIQHPIVMFDDLHTTKNIRLLEIT